jgi:glycine cleavage system H protein
MDGFSYVNIFATKGIEYLIIISFLVLIVVFWRIINRQKAVQQPAKAPGILSEHILNMPEGLFYAGNHSWAFLRKKGDVKVGIDDFLLHVTGDIEIKALKKSGDSIKKGDLVAEAGLNGKTLKIKSPVTGVVLSSNNDLSANRKLINDPYGESWIYTIKPENWKQESSSFYFDGEASEWMKSELSRFKDFLAEYSGKNSDKNVYPVMQDGGEIKDNPLAELPPDAWHDFEKSFLI